MTREFILLTGEVEASVLQSILLQVRADLSIIHAADLASLEQAAAEGGSCLIAFCTQVIVPGPVLEAVGGLAYNFHPGPPDYPGSHAASFAIYSGAKHFGVTAHVMTERVDAGPIVGVDGFAIPDGIDGAELEKITYLRLFDLFKTLAAPLVNTGGVLPELDVRWSGRKTTKRDYDKMKESWKR